MVHEECSKEDRILTIPNLLTMVRLILIPIFVWLYLGTDSGVWPAVVVVLSGLTDLADGWVARQFHMVSNFGKALDPVADKLTQAAVLFCLVLRFPVLWVILGLLLVKESLLSVIVLLATRKSGVIEGARWHGKVTTTLLYATMFLHLVWPEIPFGWSVGLCVVCAAMMLLSMVLYGLANIKVLTAPAD